nr:unnamed protein product [Callosobruchus analis]
MGNNRDTREGLHASAKVSIQSEGNFGRDRRIGSFDQKILGLLWNASTNGFCYPMEIEIPATATKRIIWSTIRKLFDQFGLINPIIVKAKMILQTLWREDSGWDKPVTGELRIAWANFAGDLNCIGNISIPRQVTHKA